MSFTSQNMSNDNQRDQSLSKKQYEINVNFYPSGSKVGPKNAQSSGYSEVKCNGKKYKDIWVKLSDNRADYRISGASPVKTIFMPRSSTKKTFEHTVEVIFNKLKEYIIISGANWKYTFIYGSIVIKVLGHCIVGARINNDFVKPLKDKIKKSYGEVVKDLKFSIALSDPAEPLVSTKDKYIKEDLSGKNGRENNFESSVIFYTAGGGFFKNKHGTNAKRNTLNKIVNFSPKLVLSAKTIVIVLENHNEQASKLVYDYLIADSDKDMAEIKKRSNGGIVIFNPHDNSNSRFIDVTKNNLKDSIKIISNYTNGKEEFRIKVLTNIIAVKLKIAKEDLLQYLPEYGEEIKKIVNSINKSRTLKSAFDYGECPN